MGKKNKKSQRYDDDDLLLGSPSSNAAHDNDNNVGTVDDDVAPTDATDAENTSSPSPVIKESKKTKKKAKDEAITIDLIRLEETMNDILRRYGGNYQSEDWLYRTLEKNMHLPKHSLRQSLEPEILDEILERVQDDVQQILDKEQCIEMNKAKRWEDLLEEMYVKPNLNDEDEATLRREAHSAGIADPNAAVAMVASKIQRRIDEKSDGIDGEDEREQQPGDVSETLSVSILLMLQPCIQQPSSQHSSLGKLFWIIRQYTCLLLYTILTLIFGNEAKIQANRTWEKLHLPSIKAAQLAQEREEDDRMLRENTHLWSNEQRCWIKRNATYSPPSAESIEAQDPLPATIRYNDTRKQWERWSKNLTTRTKAMKQAAAAGLSTSFTKGTFVGCRAGEGWATAPDQPEVESDQIANYDIHFFVCLPTKNGEILEVTDVTTWVAKTLLTRDAAHELDAMDSGKELFSVDVSTLLKKGAKKGKGGKNNKNGQKKGKRNEGEEEDETICVARKGVGCSARVSERYLDRM